MNQPKQLTRIVAVVVDTQKAQFFKENGEAIEIFQGDARLRDLLESATEQIILHGHAALDFNNQVAWNEFEKKSKGKVRFFQIAKQKLNEIFSKKEKPIDPTVVGTLPHLNQKTKEQLIQESKAVTSEIISHATPITGETTLHGVSVQRPVAIKGETPNDREDERNTNHHDKSPNTVVAVVGNKAIPGVEQIHSQFASAAKDGNTRGMEIFLSLLGRVIEHRSHTIKELLNFMERGDLPIADDGSIVIYKRLVRKGNGIYVDAHTGNVRQRVGSLVHMDPKLVDPNRRNECSSGLHVGRRGYMRSFTGDVIVLAKVRPQDVIAVPQYDANKMRVCGYHIVAELTQPMFSAIVQNRPLSAAEGGVELLSQVIAGKHIGIIEKVKITGEGGTGIEITPVKGEAPMPEEKEEGKKTSNKSRKKKAKAKKKPVVKKPVSISKRKAQVSKKQAIKREPLEAAQDRTDAPVDVRKVVAKTVDPSVSLGQEKPKQITKADVAKEMWKLALAGDKEQAQKLLDFKKEAKKSWTVLGLDEGAPETLRAILKKG